MSDTFKALVLEEEEASFNQIKDLSVDDLRKAMCSCASSTPT